MRSSNGSLFAVVGFSVVDALHPNKTRLNATNSEARKGVKVMTELRVYVLGYFTLFLFFAKTRFKLPEKIKTASITKYEMRGKWPCAKIAHFIFPH